MKNKEVFKFIRREAKKLPPETYEAYPWEFSIPDDMGNSGEKIEPYWRQTTVEYPVNHARRVKRAFLNYGWKGIEDYFKARDFLILNK